MMMKKENRKKIRSIKQNSTYAKAKPKTAHQPAVWSAWMKPLLRGPHWYVAGAQAAVAGDGY